MNTQGKHSDPLCRKKKDAHWRRLPPRTNGQPDFHLKAAQATPRKEVDLQLPKDRALNFTWYLHKHASPCKHKVGPK